MKKLSLLLLLAGILCIQNSLAQNVSCADFTIVGMNKSTIDTSEYLISIQHKGLSTVNYPHINTVVNSNSDTIAIGESGFFVQFAGKTMDYQVIPQSNMNATQFTVEFVYTNTGSSQSMCFLSFLPTATDVYSINESLTVSRNPLTNQIHINSNEENIGSSFILANTLGQVVSSGIINSAITTIDLANLNSGIYILNIGVNGRQAFKVVKE